MNELVEEADLSFQQQEGQNPNLSQIQLNQEEKEAKKENQNQAQAPQQEVIDIENPNPPQVPPIEQFQERGLILFLHQKFSSVGKCVEKQIKTIVDYRFAIYFTTNLISIFLSILGLIEIERLLLIILISLIVLLAITLYFCYKDCDQYIRGYARRIVEKDLGRMRRFDPNMSVEQGLENVRNISPERRTQVQRSMQELGIQQMNSGQVYRGNQNQSRRDEFNQIRSHQFNRLTNAMRNQQEVHQQRFSRRTEVDDLVLTSIQDVLNIIERHQTNPDPEISEGFSDFELQQIPLIKVNELCPFLTQEELDQDKDRVCTICLDGFQLNNEIPVLDCKHVYHKNCLFKWFTIQKVCPLCKKRIQINYPAEFT